MSVGILGSVTAGAAAGIIYTCITHSRIARSLNNAAYYALGTSFVTYAADSSFGDIGFESISTITLLFVTYTAISERITMDRLNQQMRRLMVELPRNVLREQNNRSIQQIVQRQHQIAVNNIEIANLRMGLDILRQTPTTPPSA